MTSANEQLIETTLGAISPDLRSLGDELSRLFPASYGAEAYNIQRLAREVPVPQDVNQTTLINFVRTTFAVTYLADRFKCVYCGLNGLEAADQYAVIQVDHLVPIWPKDMSVWNGVAEDQRFVLGYAPDNLACACRSCNAAKGNKILAITRDMQRMAKIERARQGLQREAGIGGGGRYAQEVIEVRRFVAERLPTRVGNLPG
jgi:hypothetical protein